MTDTEQTTRKQRTPKTKRVIKSQYKRPTEIKDQVFRVLELHAVDTPKELIARATDLTVPQVYNIIDEYKHVYKLLEQLPKLRQVRGQLIEATMFKLLESMNKEATIDSADLKQLAYAFQQMFNAHRLETNKSTSNHQTLSITNPKRSLTNIQ